jgi:hypothetical protein
MEEMNKELLENGTIEIVEEVAEKLTFKENVLAYGLAGVFAVGVVTTGYFAVKGVKALSDKVRDNIKGKKVESEQEVVDVEDEEIQDVDDNETEEN